MKGWAMMKAEDLIRHIAPELHVRIVRVEQAIGYLERDIVATRKFFEESIISLREDMSKLQDKLLELARELSETKGQYKNIEEAVLTKVENRLLKMALNNQLKKLNDQT